MALGSNAGIGPPTIGRRGIKHQHLAAMHLFQKNRPAADRSLQRGAVGGNFFRRVADVVTQVHAVERQA